MQEKDFEKFLRRLGDLPSLPESVLELNRALEDDSVSLMEVGDLIERDLGLASRVLKLANSSFYGLSGKVDTIPRAITLLGLTTVRNIAITAGLVEIFKKKVPGLDPRNLWVHSLHTAVIMETLLSDEDTHLRDQAFIAGLLHDVGKIVLFILFPQKIDSFNEAMKRDGALHVEVEREVFGVDHAGAGSFACREWKFPALYSDVIRLHHFRDENGWEGKLPVEDDETKLLVETLIVGNTTAKCMANDEPREAIVEKIIKLPFEKLSLDEKSFLRSLEKSDARIEEALNSFQL